MAQVCHVYVLFSKSQGEAKIDAPSAAVLTTRAMKRATTLLAGMRKINSSKVSAYIKV